MSDSEAAVYAVKSTGKPTLSALELARLRLAEAGHELPADAVFARTGAGPSGKAAGAWAWFIHSPSDHQALIYGSQTTVTALRKCHNWQVSTPEGAPQDRSIDPCHDCWTSQ